MRLTPKLTLAFMGAVAIVLAVSEWIRETRERALLATHVDERVQRALLADSLRETVVAVVALACVSGLLAWGLGLFMVERPVQRLVEKARRVGAGDFGGALAMDTRDEFAVLAEELNAMCTQLEEARRALLEETRARVAAVEQLRHADRLTTVGTLAAGLAHEFGTPLNVISARATMLARGDVPPEQVPTSAKSIGEAAARLTRIVRQLLDFVRRKPAEKRSTELRSLARRTAELLADLAKRNGVELRVAPGDDVRANVDPHRIEQALTNLVMNAVHASKSGGAVDVAVGFEHRPSADGRAEHAFVRVQDHGVGISKEDQARVFEPFFTTKGVGEGTGLGLAVTYGIVEEHGGVIELDSEPGRGSTFTIWIPV